MNIVEYAEPHSILPYIAHVVAGIIILATGAAALSSTKGSKLHRSNGYIFVFMGVLAAITALLFMADFGFVHNIFGTSILAISVSLSSILALKSPSGRIKLYEAFSLLLTLSASWVLFARFIEFASEDGLVSEASFFTFGCAFFALFFLAYDTLFIRLDNEARARSRMKRHVSGMAFIVALMIHAPVVSVFTDLDINFYLKFFTPYVLWPIIYIYMLKTYRDAQFFKDQDGGLVKEKIVATNNDE